MRRKISMCDATKVPKWSVFLLCWLSFGTVTYAGVAPPPPPNDLCTAPDGPLAVGSVTPGYTFGASGDAPPVNFCGTSISAPGVWYTVTGTGNTMTASTCNDGDSSTGSADYDSKINVYCADCPDLTCVDGNDDGPGCGGFSSSVSWPSQAGATYRVLVQGFNGAIGNYDLAILDDGVPGTGAVDCVPDSDGDGVPDNADFCPDTVIPESVPTTELRVNRFALVDGDGIFDTVLPEGVGPEVAFTIEDTGGCSCEQIIEAQELGQGHEKFGCSISAMKEWAMYVNYYNSW